MARSKETFHKKEQVKKKLQKRKEKAERREARKSKASSSFEDMLAYTDENGNIVSAPPDPSKKQVIDEKDIVIGARNSGPGPEMNAVREGRVTFFNEKKGYGFIKDAETGESLFVHYNDLTEPVSENDKVTFEMARGPRGYNAVHVALSK